MTLKRSSRDNKSMTLMRSINKERTWVTALMALGTFLWFGVVELIAMNITRTSYTTWSGGALTGRMREAASDFLQVGSASFIIVWIYAIFFGIQGFAFLFDSKKVDFYLSQPIKRGRRFVTIYMSGIINYLMIMGGGMVLGLIVAALRGGFYPALIPGAIAEYINLLIQFVAMYSITILATILCGTLFASFCSVAFFWLAEIVVRALIYALSVTYLATYPDISRFDGAVNGVMGFGITSPILNYVHALNAGATLDNFVIGEVGARILTFIPMFIINLIIGIVAAGLAYYAFEKRRAEYAGRSVAFPFMENVYKCVTAWIGGMGLGLLVIEIFENATEAPVSASGIFAICVGVFTVCVVAEGIFALNVRKIFRRAWQMPVVAVICVLFIVGFYYDWAGFDSFAPKADELSSITMTPSNDYVTLDNYRVSMDGDSSGNTYYMTRDYMFNNTSIDDVEAGLAVAIEGQKYARYYKYGEYRGYKSDVQYGEARSDSSEYGEAMQVQYTLKSGKKVYREVILPKSIDSELMDRVLSQDSYAEGITGSATINTILSRRTGGVTLYMDRYLSDTDEIGSLKNAREFAELYVKDVDEHYSYTMLQNERPVCTVSMYFDNGGDGDSSLYFPVFPSYQGTVDYIESLGYDLSDEAFYDELVAIGNKMADINISDPDPYYGVEDAEYDDDASWSYNSYSKPEEKTAILSRVQRYNSSMAYSDAMPFLYAKGKILNVDLYDDGDYGWGSTYMLYADDAPDFVKEDFKL